MLASQKADITLVLSRYFRIEPRREVIQSPRKDTSDQVRLLSCSTETCPLRFMNDEFASASLASLQSPSDVPWKGGNINGPSHKHRVSTTSLPDSTCLPAGLCFDRPDRYRQENAQWGELAKWSACLGWQKQPLRRSDARFPVSCWCPTSRTLFTSIASSWEFFTNIFTVTSPFFRQVLASETLDYRLHSNI